MHVDGIYLHRGTLPEWSRNLDRAMPFASGDDDDMLVTVLLQLAARVITRDLLDVESGVEQLPGDARRGDEEVPAP